MVENNNIKWVRHRFYSASWKPKKGMESNKYPYWITGQTASSPTYYTIVQWLPESEKLNKHWRVSTSHNRSADTYDNIEFTDRFPKPDDFDDAI